MNIYYRYEIQRFAPQVDEFDNPVGEGRSELSLRAYRVKHKTPKGVRLTNGKFILTDATKHWACPTIDEAWKSWKARNASLIRILSARVHRAQIESFITQSDARDLTKWVL